jgi:predicted ribosome quality control (RQC) complex YloA/Tae2 family protein
MCVCRSSAWNSKSPEAAYWVHADQARRPKCCAGPRYADASTAGSRQVSKTAPTGEYLSTGSFMIRGKRNYLPHPVLQMAMGVLFRHA